MDDKPSLHLLNPRGSFEDFLAFCEQLTGKQVSPEEMSHLRERCERLQARLREAEGE